MKIAVECKSPLLQKSLEFFLDKHLSILSRCDIVIRDEVCLTDERCFCISTDSKANLIKPFSKAQLILALEKRYSELYDDAESSKDKNLKKSVQKAETKSEMDFSILEKRIEFLTKEYQDNILRAVKAFYEK